ncbi:ribosomal protein S7 domain-containing protein [Nemania sp. NC0429]|nr:ribosomal protein S7 domain-containing protein [Nemania sp. NC0429]
MASKINPWRSLRGLAVRTRPSGPHHHHHQLRHELDHSSRPRPHPAASLRHGPLCHRRGLADDSSIPPPPSNTTPEPYTPRPIEPFADNYVSAEAIAALERAAAGEDILALAAEGLKYGMPPPPGKRDKLQDRHHPLIHQFTRLLMRDGKLSQAQNHVALILNYLRTSSTPKVSPLRPLLPGSPPPSQLPLNPLVYLQVAIDSVAPIVRVRSMKGMAGGGNALDIPEPISSRARRRQAIMWILDIVNRKRSMGSGRKQFATRFGQEIVAVIEGRSSAWDRRQVLHRLGTAARANLVHPSVVMGKRR